MLSLSLLTAAHNTPAQKVKTQEFGDAGGEREKMESLSLLRSLLLLAACLLLP